ncbi:MAG: tol-pal system protein YbgF [Pseudomonadota bacterium]
MKKILPLSLSGLVAVTLWMPITSVNAAGNSIEQRVQRLERMTENPVLLQLSRRLGEQQREIQQLHDAIDRLKRDLRNAEHKSDKRYKETDDRLSALESGSAVQATNSAPTATLPSTGSGRVDQVLAGPIKTVRATDLEKEKYQKAFSQMKAAKYDDAINAFEQFLSSYPQSELASNAAYWAGEGYLIKKQNQAALDSFMVVIERYPDASKVADAQLRAADSLANLDRLEDAKKMYQNVINAHPNSRAAESASKRLNGLQ